MIYGNDIFRSDEHILACLSSAPSNAKIIRTAARMALAFNGRFTALFVETPDFSVISQADRQRLKENQRLAQELGAQIETVYGEDVAYQIAEFARLSGITKIVLGRNAAAGRRFLGKPPLTEQLISYVPEMDIYIIPDKKSEVPFTQKKFRRYSWKKIFWDCMKTGGILAGATMMSLLVSRLGFTDPNIIMIYILGVLLTSVVTSHLAYSLVSSIASVFIFNYLFTIPRFTFTAYGTGYPVTFVIMFLTAFITGTFAIRYKEQAGRAARLAYRTQILFDASQLISKAKSETEILSATAEQIIRLTGHNIVIYRLEEGKLSKPEIYQSGKKDKMQYDEEKERPAVEWVCSHNHFAGATTKIMPEAACLYFSLRMNERIYGIVGIDVKKEAPDAFEHGILLSILGESALALENIKNAREKEAAAVLAESEQLRANLLRSISHDLRTPLTTISGNAGNLISNGRFFSEERREQIYHDIQEDAIWLNNLVENLLFATRIEEGHMTLSTSAEVLNDIIEEALQHMKRQNHSGRVVVCGQDDILLVRADARLIVQVLVNLLDNAAKYAPETGTVSVQVCQRDGFAEISVADQGAGISDKEKNNIFDKFYCGEKKIADNRRSLGLGLYLCRAIVEAHGGIISVKDNEPHGAVFVFTLPLEEVTVYE